MVSGGKYNYVSPTLNFCRTLHFPGGSFSERGVGGQERDTEGKDSSTCPQRYCSKKVRHCARMVCVAAMNFAPSRMATHGKQVGRGRSLTVRTARIATRCASIPVHIEYCEK